MAQVKPDTATQTTETVEESQETTLDRILTLVNEEAPADKVAITKVDDVAKLSKGARVTAAIKVLIDSLRQQEQRPEKFDDKFISALIDKLDEHIGNQVDVILHNEDFQRLESTWRGLQFLIDRTNFNENIQVKLLNVSKEDLLASFDDAEDMEDSALFKHVYTNEYDTPGAKPYCAIISNYEFENTPADMRLLRWVSQVAAAGHAPFIGAVNPRFFEVETFEEWSLTANNVLINDLETGEDYIKWRSFRGTEDARYVGLVFPRFLLRDPYDADSVKAFRYEEGITGDDHEKHLWGNASYAFAANLTRAFENYGWAVQIRGPQSGGQVENLPVPIYDTGKGKQKKIPVEVSIDERRQLISAEQGFIPLSVYKGEDYAVFFSADSAQRPTIYDDDDATTSSRLSAGLPYIFLASHIAHYMKVMLRENIGKISDVQTVKIEIDRWLKQYINKNPGPVSDEIRALRPLRDAEVTVEDVPGKPGYYRVKMNIVPHFQLEGVDIRLSLMGKLGGENE